MEIRKIMNKPNKKAAIKENRQYNKASQDLKRKAQCDISSDIKAVLLKKLKTNNIEEKSIEKPIEQLEDVKNIIRISTSGKSMHKFINLIKKHIFSLFFKHLIFKKKRKPFFLCF